MRISSRLSGTSSAGSTEADPFLGEAVVGVVASPFGIASTVQCGGVSCCGDAVSVFAVGGMSSVQTSRLMSRVRSCGGVSEGPFCVPGGEVEVEVEVVVMTSSLRLRFVSRSSSCVPREEAGSRVRFAP